MADDSRPGRQADGVDALNAANDAVRVVTAQVEDVGRHFKDAVDRAKKPETYVEMLKDLTRAAPLAMLVTAFVAGAMFASGRRRR